METLKKYFNKIKEFSEKHKYVAVAIFSIIIVIAYYLYSKFFASSTSSYSNTVAGSSQTPAAVSSVPTITPTVPTIPTVKPTIPTIPTVTPTTTSIPYVQPTQPTPVSSVSSVPWYSGLLTGIAGSLVNSITGAINKSVTGVTNPTQTQTSQTLPTTATPYTDAYLGNNAVGLNVFYPTIPSITSPLPNLPTDFQSTGFAQMYNQTATDQAISSLAGTNLGNIISTPTVTNFSSFSTPDFSNFTMPDFSSLASSSTAFTSPVVTSSPEVFNIMSNALNIP